MASARGSPPLIENSSYQVQKHIPPFLTCRRSSDQAALSRCNAAQTHDADAVAAQLKANAAAAAAAGVASSVYAWAERSDLATASSYWSQRMATAARRSSCGGASVAAGGARSCGPSRSSGSRLRATVSASQLTQLARTHATGNKLAGPWDNERAPVSRQRCAV